MEGEFGARAKEARRKYFEKNDCFELSSNVGGEREPFFNFSMVSDSESSTEEEESDLTTRNDKKSSSRKLSLSNITQIPKEGINTKVDMLFQAKKTFFSNEAKKRTKEWIIIINHYDDSEHAHKEEIDAKIHDLLQFSIPKELRCRVWCLFTSAYDLLQKGDGIYNIFLTSQHDEYDEAIRSDIGRTLPEHPLFASPDGEGQKAMFNILKAYAVCNRAVGYAQCMNYIAGYLYSQIRSEELTFWTFVSFMQNIKGLFTVGLPLLTRSVDIFGAIIQRHLPVLHAHFATQKFSICPVISQWCSTLLCIAEIPFKFSIHVLDIIMYKGYNYIFRIGAAILSEGQNLLLKLQAEEIQQCLQKPPFLQNHTSIISRANRMQFDEEIVELISCLDSLAE